MNDRQQGPLGPLQKHVLLVLANRGVSTATDWAAWYPLQHSDIRGAIYRLGRRGLVDAAGFDGQARTYQLTKAGYDVADGLDADALLDLDAP